MLGTGWVVSAHDCTTTRGTGWCRSIGLPKLHPSFGKGVNMRGLHGRWFIDIIAFNILPTQAIGQNEYYIWLGRSFIGEADKSKYEKQREGEKILHVF